MKDLKDMSLLHILQEQNICRISHIGSTSVDGLIAKPIVDILLELPHIYDLDTVTELLQRSNWIEMKH